MRVSQSAHEAESARTVIVTNCIFHEKESVADVQVGFPFVEIDEITWSIGSLGFVEVIWDGFEGQGKAEFVLSGNGRLPINVRRPVGSNGAIVLRFNNFDAGDAGMVVIKGDRE